MREGSHKLRELSAVRIGSHSLEGTEVKEGCPAIAPPAKLCHPQSPIRQQHRHLSFLAFCFINRLDPRDLNCSRRKAHLQIFLSQVPSPIPPIATSLFQSKLASAPYTTQASFDIQTKTKPSLRDTKMDMLKNAMGGDDNKKPEEGSGEQGENQGGFLGGIGEKLNSAAGGGKESEKNEDYLDKGELQTPTLSNMSHANVLDFARRRRCAAIWLGRRQTGRRERC